MSVTIQLLVGALLGVAMNLLTPCIGFWFTETALAGIGAIFACIATAYGGTAEASRRRIVVYVATAIALLIPIGGEFVKRREAISALVASAENEAVQKLPSIHILRSARQTAEAISSARLAAQAEPKKPILKRADLAAAFLHGMIIPRPNKEGQYLAQVVVTLSNPTDFDLIGRVRAVQRAGGWKSAMGVGAEPWTISVSARQHIRWGYRGDTVGDPNGTLRRGEKLYSSFRVDWHNSDGSPGCKVFFVALRGSTWRDGVHLDIDGDVYSDAPKEIVGGLDGLPFPLCEKASEMPS